MAGNLAYQNDATDHHETPQGIRGAHIVWRPAGGAKGRGVFTTQPIKKGEVIEVAPVVPLSAENVPENDAPDGYVLEWDDETPGQEYAMALGYIMLYNHSDEPNLMLETDIDEKTVSATATRDIKAGEELVWNYNCDLWFPTEE